METNSIGIILYLSWANLDYTYSNYIIAKLPTPGPNFLWDCYWSTIKLWWSSHDFDHQNIDHNNTISQFDLSLRIFHDEKKVSSAQNFLSNWYANFQQEGLKKTASECFIYQCLSVTKDWHSSGTIAIDLRDLSTHVKIKA